MSDSLTVEDVLDLVAERAQEMREDGPADMREMLSFVRLIRDKVKAGASRNELLAYLEE